MRFLVVSLANRRGQQQEGRRRGGAAAVAVQAPELVCALASAVQHVLRESRDRHRVECRQRRVCPAARAGSTADARDWRRDEELSGACRTRDNVAGELLM